MKKIKKMFSVILVMCLLTIPNIVGAADLCITGKAHDWSALTVVPASCTEKEYQTKTCYQCHQVYKKYVSGSEALGHDFSATTKTVTKEPTCTEKGSKAIVCTREDCKAIKEGTVEEIPRYDHNWYTLKVVIKEPSCEVAGEKATICKDCKTIKEGSIEKISTLGHDWALSSSIAPDCQNAGKDTYKCKRTGCGKSEDRKIDPLECDYKETIKKPTCESDGYSTFTCTMCKSSYIDKKVEKLNHNIDCWYEKSPTCTEDGITRYGCLDCDYTYTEPALAFGHDYPSDWSVILAPDCQSKGASIKVCLNCNDVISQTLPKTGHVDSNNDTKCDTCDKTIAVVEPEKEPEAKPCDCDCHKGGIKAFFFNILNFFAKIFDKSKRVCACGTAH